MTQMLSTAAIQTGTQVTHRTEDDLAVGEVIESDGWFDTIRLPGVAAEDQVLVAWETGSDDGAPMALWVEIADLAPVTTGR